MLKVYRHILIEKRMEREMNAFAKTDVGIERAVNQDYVYTKLDNIGCLPNIFVVADGMGGHKAGDMASRSTVDTLIELLKQSAGMDPLDAVDDNIKLKAFEADALYAGINIDTDGFNSKSGPRTFEAAAFLRRHGADVTRVRKMLRSNMNEYKEIAKAVSRVEVYKDAFAISIFNGDGIDTPTVGGAKTANDLLDISGIKASFVITPYEDKIYVSARSIDEVNVQLVMEKLGGGGHISIAGAQFTDCTIDQAINKIKLTLDNMIKDGEI